MFSDMSIFGAKGELLENTSPRGFYTCKKSQFLYSALTKTDKINKIKSLILTKKGHIKARKGHES